MPQPEIPSNERTRYWPIARLNIEPLTNELQPHDPEQLRAALCAFSEVSSELTRSYGLLQRQVQRLEKELRANRLQIEQERQAKQRLEQRWAQLAEVLPVGIVVTNAEQHIEEHNTAATTLFNRPLKRAYWPDLLRDAADSAPDGPTIILENNRHVRLTQRSLEHGGQLIAATDVTELTQLQQQVAHQQRLAELGEATSRLAHQIRTPLATAMLDASALLREPVPEVTRVRCARIVDRLQALERSLAHTLTYARRHVGEKELITVECLLSAVAADTTPLCTATLSWPATPPVGTINGNLTALKGALSNLVVNANDAGASEIRIEAQLRDGSLIISCHDNGGGIDAQIHEHIFDPFYTTKTTGTGLGLPIAAATFTAHGGTLQLGETQPGATTFTARLPCRAAAVEAQQA